MNLLLGMILVGLPLFASAAIYQITDAQGNVYFTDQPSPNAKPVDLDSAGMTQTSPPASSVKNIPQNKETDEAVKNYQAFSITAPVDQATLWNQPTVAVSVDVKPDLIKGDKIAIFLDGKQVAEGAGTQFNVDHPDRGQRSLVAKILGANGGVKKESSPVTIFVHYGKAGQ
jgi:hypothetical protein